MYLDKYVICNEIASKKKKKKSNKLNILVWWCLFEKTALWYSLLYDFHTWFCVPI